MKKLLKRISAILLLILLVFIIWFISLRSTTGYVYQEMELNPYGDLHTKNIWVVELEPDETEGKTKAEIIEAVQEQADTSRFLDEGSTDNGSPGTIYRIPLINRQIDTKFQIGDKVKIYWRGAVMESLPGQIDGTVLVIKTGK
ncbi:hypothetical protein [Planococcus halocryophilus]|uniref:hypothetical protein n=1 Tax=Planococcus halocryophilus TaxID=1215089 RepID=UPI001F0F9F1E|nr:hypothetical protein [Planococcus halocryophilus]MCH4828157.1 hypothetical protein [Planococcus halocryophilus]